MYFKEREVFLTPDNKVWDGSVHMHITDVNPDENGYKGNGEASDIPTWWMAGKNAWFFRKEAAEKFYEEFEKEYLK